jgi:hypothetical protein
MAEEAREHAENAKNGGSRQTSPRIAWETTRAGATRGAWDLRVGRVKDRVRSGLVHIRSAGRRASSRIPGPMRIESDSFGLRISS